MLNLDLSKINDFYTREVFRQLINYISQNEEGREFISQNTNIINKTNLDGSENITGTILPDSDGAHNLGSETNRLGEVHAQSVYVAENTLYMGGHPTISNESGALTFKGGEDQDVAIKALGTGRVLLDCEGDVEINTQGSVTINGIPIASNTSFQKKYNNNQFVNNREIVLDHVPVENSLTVFLNGIDEKKYSRNANVITFDSLLDNEDEVRTIYQY